MGFTPENARQFVAQAKRRAIKSLERQNEAMLRAVSERIMPLDDEMIADLLAWRKQTTYAKDRPQQDAQSQFLNAIGLKAVAGADAGAAEQKQKQRA
jgi:hypothetical protein